MAKARKRVMAKGDFNSNGVNLAGIRFIVIGPCTMGGATKTPEGKKPLKGDLTHFLMRYEDKKVPRQLKVPKGDFPTTQKHFDLFFTEVE